MCGIVGIWDLQSNKNNQQYLEGMASMLYHRGPDDFGFYKNESGQLLFGHARLSIIDLEQGHQPLIDTNTKNALVVNGEFYDYQAIRTHLICQGYSFKTKSDSEIALPLFHRHGLDFVHHLRGEFAIALYDHEHERLILVRDRFGIRPLFYHINPNGSLYFGSEIKAILSHPSVPRKFSTPNLVHQMMQTMVPGTTAFEGIQAVEPGQMVIIEKKNNAFQVTHQTYWDMEFPHKDFYKDRKSPETYIQGVQEKLIESVQCRLVADVPVGCYLSGGIDSCSILGLANALEQESLRAYTISFDHDDYDELSIAKQMADKTKAEQIILKLNSDNLYGADYIKTVWHSERTFYNTLGVAKWHMSKRVHENKDKVVITGEGSDELFAGYPQLKLDFALHDPAGYGDTAKDILEKNKLFVGHILSETQQNHSAFDDLMGFTPSWIQPWMLTLKNASTLIHPDILSQLKNYDPIAAIAQKMDKKALDNRHPLDCAQYTWIKTMLECQILNWGGDRVDMANSMESRPAFLDHHLAEYATRIPPNIRINGGIEKWVLREAMKGILPEVLYKRQKFAFMAPPAYTDPKKQLKIHQLKDQFLTDEAIDQVGFFSKDALNHFFSTCFSQKEASSSTRSDILINHTLGIHILHKLFIQNDLPQQAMDMRQQHIKGNKWIS